MLLRSFSLATVTVFAGALVGCGGGDDKEETPAIDTLFPADNEIGSWVEDTTAVGFNGQNPDGVEIATTYSQAIAAVDGDADVFNDHGFVAMGREFYTNGAAQLELRIWQMPDAAAATTLYDDLPEEDSRYDIDWDAVTFGDAARTIDTGVSYWYNVRDGAYFIDMMGLRPNDAATKTAGEAFLTAVVAGLP